jgi:3-oxoacyl-[acyl-carrier protein] reductase
VQTAGINDVTDDRQVAELVGAVGDLLGSVDVLVLNATGPQPEGALGQVSWEEHAAQLDFFVKSPVLLGRAALSGMVAQNWGRIVQIDSEVVDRSFDPAAARALRCRQSHRLNQA